MPGRPVSPIDEFERRAVTANEDALSQSFDPSLRRRIRDHVAPTDCQAPSRAAANRSMYSYTCLNHGVTDGANC
jgi:hypothetical protein